MEISGIIPHIEALIFASDKPLTTFEITTLINTALGFIDDQADTDQIDSAINGIKEKYDSEFYAFELKQSGGGWQFLTKPEYHKTIALINGDKFIKRLSAAALETLAIIAYKQPITKSEMESIRGVNCDYAVQKLLEKDLVIIAGRNEEAVGKPLIYATSKSFMDYFGINSAAELPKINEMLMDEMILATPVINPESEEENEDGEDNTPQQNNNEVKELETEVTTLELAQTTTIEIVETEEENLEIENSEDQVSDIFPDKEE